MSEVYLYQMSKLSSFYTFNQNIKYRQLPIIILFVLIGSLTSCSSDDDAQMSPPSISFSSEDLIAGFFTAGAASPTINWNGEEGTVTLNEVIRGLTVNEDTGELTWTRELPEGIHTVTLTATNSIGSQSIEIELDNTLQGIFTGTYDNVGFLEFEFYTDGTLDVRINNTPDLATGVWTKNGDEIQVDYTYPSGWKNSTRGDIVHTLQSVRYFGNWYFEHGAVAGEEGGVFEIILD